MDGSSARPEFYHVGGTLTPDAPSYVERLADRELFERAMKGDFCYVLTPRQMGKSSLMARTARRLAAAGVGVAIIDLTTIGSEDAADSANKWYYGMARRILRELKIDLDLDAWWRDRERLPALQRLTELFSDVVLAQSEGSVVIFVDEIDTTITLGFTDDFFAAIRACYNARATEPAYARLSFVLLGVASPADLIKDSRRTPFNIGRRVELTDFTAEEARPLASGLPSNPEQNARALDRILYWTGGHPYLTQKLSQALAEADWDNGSLEAIDQLVEHRLLSPEANSEESNLNYVRDRLTKEGTLSRKVLKLYRRIFNGAMITDAPLLPAHTALKLSGIVKVEPDRSLKVRNEIYRRVFDNRWVKRSMPVDIRQRVAFAAATAVVLLALGTSFFSLRAAYSRQLGSAIEDYPGDAYEKLHWLPGCGSEANELLAQFWERQAALQEHRENRDEALLLRLQALAASPTDRRRRYANLLVGSDYPKLRMTFRVNANVTAVAFSPDNETVLTGTENEAQTESGDPKIDGELRLWRIDSGEPLKRHPLKSAVRSVVFSTDGSRILVGAGDSVTVHNSDLEPRLLLSSYSGYESSSLLNGVPVAFNTDGKLALAGMGRPSAEMVHDRGLIWVRERPLLPVRLWETGSGALMRTFDFRRPVTGVAFSPRTRVALIGFETLAAGRGSAVIVPLDSVRNRLPIGLSISTSSEVTCVAYSPDGSRIALGMWRGGEIIQLDAGTNQPLRRVSLADANVKSVAFSSDGRLLATGGHAINLWDADSGLSLGPSLLHERYILSLTFSPKGTLVLSGGVDGTARLWSVDGSVSSNASLARTVNLTCYASSSDGKVVATSSGDVVQMWSSDSGRPIGSPLVLGAPINGVAVSPDGKFVLAGGGDDTDRFGLCRMWRVDTGIQVGPVLRTDHATEQVAFSPDGRRIVSQVGFSSDLWNAGSGQKIGSLDQAGGLAFSPSGSLLAMGFGSVHLFNAQSLEEEEAGDIDGSVSPGAFNPDGTLLLTTDDKGTSLWRVATREKVGSTLGPGDSAIPSAIFSPDGKWAVTAGRQWIHLAAVTETGLVYESSRLVPLAGSRILGFDGTDGFRVRILSMPTPDSIRMDVAFRYSRRSADRR
jgi:WD40 repeat protein